ncbi:MAG: hypothetical protein Q9191_004134 [Dirinaria sp. TL-2023a]
MRTAPRLLAAVKPGQYLTPGNPTGLCGLFTHPSPRSTLIATYSATLSKLRSFPDHSVYRQSVEAITRHRLSVIESVKPDGYDEWAARASEKIKQNPGLFKQLLAGDVAENARPEEVQGRMSIDTRTEEEKDDREVEWDGEPLSVTPEGPRSEEERAYQGNMDDDTIVTKEAADWEAEPALEARQIIDVENQIGAGLVEEVIQVAEGELQLVNIMAENKVWEELEQKAPAGQWAYFARDQHTLPTQEPPVDKKY